MEKILAGDPASESLDVRADNIEKLKVLFPELLTESANGAAINVDVLKQLVGDATATDAEEKYGLNWHGKRRARQLALTPSAGTLRPCTEDSVDWDVTQNLMIEGDNLEVLKLLQKSYANKVKMIYIDPPYNTGNDFVYPDDFRDSIKNYKQITGQTDLGRPVSSNTEASGRFHTDWLNMMYPRLKLARSLLREDGVIFVSIDDHELANVRCLLSEVFGDENFVGVFVWKRRTGAMDSVNNVSTDHEYVVCYSRALVVLNGMPRTFARYANPDNDERGPWIADNLSAAKPGGDTYYPITDPSTGHQYFPPAGRFWPYSRITMQKKIDEGRVIFPGRPDGAPLLKRFEKEARSLVQPVSTWIVPASQKAQEDGGVKYLRSGLTSEGTKTIKELFGTKMFSYAKPISLLEALLQQATRNDTHDIVLDFFAGSATLGHAVYSQNAKDGGNRRFILVQLPELLDPNIDEQKIAAKTCARLAKPENIAELAKERLRRAGAGMRNEITAPGLDAGFRSFKLDTSNIKEWDPSQRDLEMALFDATENLKSERADLDVLYELLLKFGLELTTPVQVEAIEGHDLYCVGGGSLFACLSSKFVREDIEPLAAGIVALRERIGPACDTLCVFRDSAFADDVVKSNLSAILVQHGFGGVRSL